MIKCPFCEFEHSYLIEHLQKKHQLTTTKYREQYGFDQELVDVSLYDLVSKELSFNRKGNLGADKYFQVEDIDLEKLPEDSSRNLIPELDPDYLFPIEARWLAMAIQETKNVFLTGFPGTGKSSLVLQLYSRLRRNLFHVSCFSDLTYEHLIYKDELKTNAITGNLETRGHYGVVIQSMLDEKNKAGLLFDEISFTDPRVLQVLQPLLETSTRYLTIPETGEIIHAHPDWVFFATDNTRGQGDEVGMFAGAEQMNFSFLNRFAYFLELDYLTRENEEKILKKKLARKQITLTKEIYDKAFQVAQQLRIGIKEGRYFFTFSLRDLYEWLLKLKYFKEPKKAMIECAKVTFVNKLDRSLQQGILHLLEDVIG